MATHYFKKQVKVKIILKLKVSRPLCQGNRHPSGALDQFLFSFFKLSWDSCGFANVGRPLSREAGSVINSCCWASPAQSLSGPSPTGLMTVSYYLNFETPWTCRAQLYPQAMGFWETIFKNKLILYSGK
jgi:hypothetical protein